MKINRSVCLLAACATLWGCASDTAPTSGSSESERVQFAPVGFGDLPGWDQDHQSESLVALQKSCPALTHKTTPTTLKPGMSLRAVDWNAACAALATVPANDDAAARRYFESYFQPYQVSGKNGTGGLFTGYYEAELQGARMPGGMFQTPLYARPDDLITVNLGDFVPEWKGKHIAGKVALTKKNERQLIPYDTRGAIAQGSLAGRAQVLAYVSDPVDAFFLAVQGSGRVALSDGGILRVGYDGSNGHTYTAIGRTMSEAGEIDKPVTMAKIRSWLAAHPTQAQTVMNRDQSYIFFRPLDTQAPIGAQGVELTPERSMAVDPAFIPLGAPIWLDADNAGTSIRRLMIAQDTGGAIKGTVRGDFFWGFGASAAQNAGNMQAGGGYYLLLPKSVSPAS